MLSAQNWAWPSGCGRASVFLTSSRVAPGISGGLVPSDTQILSAEVPLYDGVVSVQSCAQP
jgi:hypothetical protein